MTTLLIQSETIPLTVHLPSLERLTDEQFYELCQINSDLRLERSASGEVIIMPPAFSDTGNRNMRLAQQVTNWADQDDTGEPFDSSAGFTLPNGAIRPLRYLRSSAPDASWIKLDRWNALTDEQKASFAPICPDFVVELRSSSNTLKSLQTKMQEYIDNGAILGFLIDRKNCMVEVYRPARSPEILSNPDRVSGDPELPGFVLQMAKIW